MAKLLKLRRGTTTQHASFTGAEGEVTIDTTKDTAVVHDGSQAGGRPLAREDMSNVSSANIAGQLGTDSIATTKIAAGALPTDVTVADANISGNLTIESADIVDGTIVSGDIADGTIVNGDIAANAAIAGTKLENSGVTAGAYGSSSAIPIVTVDAQGLVTAASTTAIDSTTIANGTSNVAVANNGNITATRSGTARLVVDDAGVDVTGNINTTGGNIVLDTDCQVRRKTGATNAVVSGMTQHVRQHSLELSSSEDIWLTSSGNKITFGTSDGAVHEVMRVQCAAVGASQHGFVNLNYVTANAGGSASSATKLNTTSSGVTVSGDIAVTGTVDGVDISTLNIQMFNLSTSNGVLKDGVTATTQAQSDNTTKVSTTAYVRTAISEAQAFPSGTKMLFQQTSAPTGWTKVTSGVDNKALRVVSGTVGSGGNVAFTSAFTNRGITANSGNTTAGGNVSVANTTAGGNVNISSVSTSGNVNSHTLSTNEMPSHDHTTNISTGYNANWGNFDYVNAAASSGGRGSWTRANATATGGGGGHSHGFSGSSHNHNGSLSGTAHNHNASFSGSAHNHSISVTNLDLQAQYLDVIIAAKD